MPFDLTDYASRLLERTRVGNNGSCPPPTVHLATDPSLLSKNTIPPVRNEDDMARLMRCFDMRALPSAKALVDGSPLALDSLTSVIHSLDSLYAFLSRSSTQFNTALPTAKTLLIHWPDILSWVCFLVSTLAPCLQESDKETLFYVVSRFVVVSITLQDSFAAFPGVIQLCMDLWVDTNPASLPHLPYAHSIQEDLWVDTNPASLPHLLYAHSIQEDPICPIICLTRMLVERPVTRTALFELVNGGHQQSFAQCMVDRLAMLRAGVANFWMNQFWVINVTRALYKILHYSLLDPALENVLSKLRPLRHLFRIYAETSSIGMALGTHISASASFDDGRRAFDKLLSSSRCIKSMSDAVSGGLFRVIFNLYSKSYQQPPTFEGRIQDFAIVVATHTILHSGYLKVGAAVAAEWKRSTSEVQYCLTYLSDDVPLIHLIEAWRDVVTNPTLIKNDKKLSPRKAHICHYIKCAQAEQSSRQIKRCSTCRNVFYCSRSCQTEDWRILHRLECAPFDNIKGSFPASYRAQLGLHMENICNIQSGTFGPTLKNDHPRYIVLIKATSLPISFAAISRENFCSDYVDSPGTVHYAQRLRIYTYLDEFETHSDRVKLVHGLFVYGVDIVGVLARFHYSPDASPNFFLTSLVASRHTPRSSSPAAARPLDLA